MTTDLYMPDVKVEIAFNAGYTTPASSRTWTDVSSYVELGDQIEIDFGRQDERSTADANSLSLTLDNSDGRFTADRSASPYYPNVKLGRPIRVTVTPNDNHCPNGGFEVNDTGWATNTALGTYGSATEARSTTRAYSGAASLLITWPTHGTGSWDGFTMSTTVGHVYTVTCRVWVPAGSPNPRIEVLFLTAGARTSTKSAWVQLTHTFTATSTSHFVGIQVATPTAGQQCYVDEFMVNRGEEALPYTSEVATPSTRFVGFVGEWPVEWDGTDTYARASITASSRLARLGLSKLKSMPEEQILLSRPTHYWTLGDPQDAPTAAESSGNNRPALAQQQYVYNGLTSAPVVFGSATGPPTDGLTAAEFTGHDPNTAPCLRLGFEDAAGAGSCRGFRFSIRVATLGASDWVICVVRTVGGSAPGDMTVTLRSTGVLQVSTLVGTNINDGQTHDVAFVWDSTTASLVIDGVVVDTDSTATSTTSGVVTYGFFGALLTGTMSHVAIWDDNNPATVADVQEQAAMMTAAGAAERTDERVVRLLEWAGVPASEVTVQTGVETMTYQLTSGSGVVDALRKCESTEGGVLFDGRDGNVTFHNRSHRYGQAVAVTLDMSSQQVGTDYAPRVDPSTLVNDVTVENPTTGESARAVDSASRDEYGFATATETSVSTSSAALAERADWLLSLYAEPRSRVPSLSVDVLAHQGLTPSAQDLLALTIGDLIEVENAPTQADATTQTYFIEGGTETIGPQSYALTFNVSPSSPMGDVFILDSTTRGLLDTDDILAL